MGCWDVFCVICGITCHGPLDPGKCDKGDEDCENDKNVFKKIGTKTKWLNKCTFLTANNKILHDAKEVSCNVDFVWKGKTYQHIGLYIDNTINGIIGMYENYGIFVHTDCWKFIKNEYDLELKYGYLFIDKTKFVKPVNYYKVINIDYGIVEKYWGQDFAFSKVVENNDEYICMSPLKNAENAKRIKKIINKLKLRGDKNRRSPSVSASFYKTDTIKIGNDDNFWKISKGKWIKMNGDVRKKIITISTNDKKQMKVLKKLPQVGEFNTSPIFVESFEENKNQISVTVVILE